MEIFSSSLSLSSLSGLTKYTIPVQQEALMLAISLIHPSAMLNRYFLTFLLLLVILGSCDPRIAVVITNKSKVDKNIRVIYPAHFRLPINSKEGTNDSLLAYDHSMTGNYISLRDNYRYPLKIPILLLDTVARTYSFNLKAEHEVIIESRWLTSVPTYGQIFIIENADTIELKRHGKIFKKRPQLLLGGSWTYTINDNKN